MKKLYLIILILLTIISDPSFGQDTSSCFLLDFTAKDAVIPPYENYARTTTVPTVTLNIDYNDTVSEVSKYIFGNAVAVWVSPNINNPTVIGHLEKLMPSLIRFPGGSWSDVYFWNGNPGDLPTNVPNSEGVMEPLYPQFGSGHSPTFSNYLNMRDQINAQGLVTINYAYARYGLSEKPAEQAAHIAAEWVRNDNGRTKFWEIGNESAGTWEAGWRIDTVANQDDQPLIITGELYGKHFNIFADSMRKAADEVGAEIFIGAQIIQYDGTNSWNIADRDWNEGVFREVGDTADFYVIHNYFGGIETNPTSYLNTALSSINDMHTFIQQDIESKGAAKRPIALTEWNMSDDPGNVKSSVINGMQGVLAMSEMAKLGYGLSCRWLLANWNTDGMFYHGDDASIPAWNPRPDFYYLYFLQKYIGSYFLGSELTGSNDIKAYTTLFNSGRIGIVLVNKGATSQAVGINLQNTGFGSRYYHYTLTGGEDDPNYSKYVFVNDSGPEPTRWGPLANLENLKARSDTLIYPIKIHSPRYSVQYILIETGDSLIHQVDAGGIDVYAKDDILTITEDNGTIQLMADVFPWNVTENGVIWSTSDSSVALVDGFGVTTAIYNGSVYIIGTTLDGEYADSVEVTVSNQRYEVTGLSLTTETGERTIATLGGSLQIIPVFEPENAEDQTITWSVNDTNRAMIDIYGLLTAQQNGRVVVTGLTNDGGYSATIVIDISGQVGLRDISLVNLNVFPVPARNLLYIENDAPVLSYEIVNIEGKVLKTINKPGLKAVVDISGFARGVYFLQAQTQTNTRVIKFIK